MMRTLAKTAPELVPEVQQRYSNLQGKGLDTRYATGRVTKPAYEAMQALQEAGIIPNDTIKKDWQ